MNKEDYEKLKESITKTKTKFYKDLTSVRVVNSNINIKK